MVEGARLESVYAPQGVSRVRIPLSPPILSKIQLWSRSVTIVFMLAYAFFSWWYGQGWKSVFEGYGRRSKAVTSAFSVRQLSTTLFEPWRRIITYPGDSLSAKFKAWGDNVFSRAIGFVVRCIVLFASLIALLLATILTTIELVAWPLLPISVPVLLIAGLL